MVAMQLTARVVSIVWTTVAEQWILHYHDYYAQPVNCIATINSPAELIDNDSEQWDCYIFQTVDCKVPDCLALSQTISCI